MAKKRLLLLLTVAWLFVFTQSAFADVSGVINIDFSVENHTVGIEGGQFALVKVLDIKDGAYEPVETAGLSVDEILADPVSAAKTIALASPKGALIITGKDGKASLGGLSDGVYLLYQTGRSGSSLDYNTAVPALIDLPHWEEDTLTWSVTVYPKTTEFSPAEPDQTIPSTAIHTPVKTGDDSNAPFYMWLMLFSAMLIICIGTQGGQAYEN